jgi:GntR family transcriptional repressor for pyruvate dehydrogenase complex
MEKISFSQIKTKRLPEVIENRIKKHILSGKYQPGDRLLNEKELSLQFGVSLVTVREALKGLESLGLVEKKRGRNGGIFIGEIKSDSVKMALHGFLSTKKVSYKDISELRVILEPISIRKATSRITPLEIEKLEENVRYCEGLIRNSGDSFSEKEQSLIEKKNVEFHTLIAKATQNPLLTFTIESEMDLLFGLKKSILKPDIQHSEQGIKEHRNILKQLKIGNAKEAEEAMARHIRNLEKYLLHKGFKIENQESEDVQ